MTGDGETDRPQNKSSVSLGKIVTLIAVVIAVIFIIQNSGTGTVSFLFWEFQLPTWVWAIGLFLLGGVSGYSWHWSRARARRKTRRND